MSGRSRTRSQRQTFADGPLEWSEQTGYDQWISACLRSHESILQVLCYPPHGLQMVVVYLGQLAPASRIVIVCLLQAGDEIHRVQRCAFSMRELPMTHSGFGDVSRAEWRGKEGAAAAQWCAAGLHGGSIA